MADGVSNIFLYRYITQASLADSENSSLLVQDNFDLRPNQLKLIKPTHMCVCVSMYVRTYVRTYASTHTHTYICTYIRTYLYTVVEYMNVCLYVCTDG